MAFVRSRFDSNTVFKNRTPMTSQFKKGQDDVARMNYEGSSFDLINTKRKRPVADEFDRALINDQTALFETKSLKDVRKTMGYQERLDTRRELETSDKISKNIRKRFMETTKQSEEYTKELKALNCVRPKIENLIDAEESNTDLANNLQTDGYFLRMRSEYA